MYALSQRYFKHQIITPNSIQRASTMLPNTVIRSNMFHGSLKKFYKIEMYMLLKCRINYACICYYVKQITDDNIPCFLYCFDLLQHNIGYTLVIRWNLQCDSDVCMFVLFTCISKVLSLYSKTQFTNHCDV